MSMAYISCDGYMLTQDLVPHSLDSNLGVCSNNLQRYKFCDVTACKQLLWYLKPEAKPEVWVKPIQEEEGLRFGYSSMFMMSKYHYVILLTHDLEKNTIQVTPRKWNNGTQDAFNDMETYTLSDTCTAEELSETLKKAYTFLESYSPIPEKYRTQPLNREKVIAKWRKEHADDPRVAIDIAKEKEIMEKNN